MENNCRICRQSIDNLIIAYKFSNCYTIHSNLLIQEFLESILSDKIDISEAYICQRCYNFVNELDELQENFRKGSERLKQIFIGNKTETQNYIIENVENICFTGTKLEGNPVDRKYTCTICMEIFNFSEELNKHCECEHNVTSTYSEDKNKDTFINKQIENEKACNICSKVFKTTSKLMKHVTSHNVSKSFTCEICGASYKSEKALKVHVGMHNGVNPFTCEHCNKPFGQKISLIRHLPIHTGEAPHQCDLCGKRFIHHTSFRFHKMSHTGQKDVKCDVCDLAFRSTSHLKRHSKVHTGEKKFACMDCGKQFAERYNLSVHQKLHGAQKLGKSYKCDLCHVSFNRKLYLEKHLDKNHQKLLDNNM